MTISFLATWVYSSFHLSAFFPVGFLRILNSTSSITLDILTISFFTTSVYSSFYFSVFSRLGLRNVNSITLDILIFFAKARSFFIC